MTVVSDFLRAVCLRIPNFVDAGLEIGIFHCFTAFFLRSETRGFRAECGAHPAGGKIHAASLSSTYAGGLPA